MILITVVKALALKWYTGPYALSLSAFPHSHIISAWNRITCLLTESWIPAVLIWLSTGIRKVHFSSSIFFFNSRSGLEELHHASRWSVEWSPKAARKFLDTAHLPGSFLCCFPTLSPVLIPPLILMASSRYQHQSRGNRPSASLYHCQHCLHQPRLPPSTDRCPFSFWSYLSSPPVHQHRQPWQYSTLGPQEAILVQRTLTCHVLWWPYGVGLLCKTLDICVKTKEKKKEVNGRRRRVNVLHPALYLSNVKQTCFLKKPDHILNPGEQNWVTDSTPIVCFILTGPCKQCMCIDFGLSTHYVTFLSLHK